MNISLKSVKIIYWLVLLTVLLGILLVIQLKPETHTWRLVTLQILFCAAAIGLFFYVNKLFAKAMSDASLIQGRRFNSKIKTQLWGLFVRIVSGAAGYGLAALFLQTGFDDVLVISVILAVFFVFGFVNDGKRFDENH